MAKYIVSYDLRKPDKDYPDLINYLNKLAGVRILLSVWLVKSQIAAAALMEAIVKNGKVDANDRIFVGELGASASWERLLATDVAVQNWYGTS